jgi:nucleoside-diphosphate-sugar epimerase
METVLITGGTGMIGKALTQALIERGFNVIILTRHINDKQKPKTINYLCDLGCRETNNR